MRTLERELSDEAAETERMGTEADVEAEAWTVEHVRFEQEEMRWERRKWRRE
jgi:hypothetical protein